jgi:DNA repair protein RadA/Sms
MEGSRPILVEVQALTVPTSLSFPRRVANGIAEKRLELLLAVIQKHARIPVERMDVFVNIVGGLKIQEPAADLAVCLSIISSFQNKAYPGTVAVGEVGLLGEIKTVVNLEKRIKEAKKLGFTNVMSFKSMKFLRGITQ